MLLVVFWFFAQVSNFEGVLAIISDNGNYVDSGCVAQATVNVDASAGPA